MHAYTAAHVFRHTSASTEVESSEPSFKSFCTGAFHPIVEWRATGEQKEARRKRSVLIREMVEGAEMIRTLAVSSLGVSCAKSVGCTTSDKIGTAAAKVGAK